MVILVSSAFVARGTEYGLKDLTPGWLVTDCLASLVIWDCNSTCLIFFDSGCVFEECDGRSCIYLVVFTESLKILKWFSNDLIHFLP